MSSRAPIVGIDLGTTFSLVAVMQGETAVVIPNMLGETLTPSAVSVDERGTVLVGAPARARATTDPTRTALSFKRDMGTDRVVTLGPLSASPTQLSALVLSALKSDAEAMLGMPVEEAVITVPAYFGDLQRQATRDAGKLAGLRVERIINEPTAAALAYGLHERHKETRAVVLDLGGGTFDVTVLEIMEGVIEIQSSAGDARLGGDDFDEALAQVISKDAKERDGFDLSADPRNWARLRAACEEAKKRLSTMERTAVVLSDLASGKGKTATLERMLTREEAEAAWAPQIDRLRAPIARALRDASVRPDTIEQVLLVGGSTRMPAVARLAAQLFGKLPLRSLPADEAVAMGAAVQAALKEGNSAVEDMVVTDVAPFSLGIATAASMGDHVATGVFAPILERGTVIPASRVRRFQSTVRGQRQIRVEVFQGEHSLCRENQKLGEYVIDGLVSEAGKPSEVDIRFTYDLNGILEVDGTDVSTGRKSVFVIERRPGSLTPQRLKEAQQAMSRLKMDPREALPNRTALTRADAVYVELTGVPREVLGQSIAHFRAVLERQDAQPIDRARDELNALVAQLTQRA